MELCSNLNYKEALKTAFWCKENVSFDKSALKYSFKRVEWSTEIVFQPNNKGSKAWNFEIVLCY